VVLSEIGLDLGDRQPQTLDELEDDYFDVIVTLAPEGHHRALELTRGNAVEVIYWPTPDPTGATGTRERILEAYREVRDMLKQRISSGKGWSRAPAAM
jgi:protein-tyrosine-phosphatase